MGKKYPSLRDVAQDCLELVEKNVSAVGSPKGGKGGRDSGEQCICGKNGAGCRDGRGKGANVGWAIIGVSANPWVHHLQI